MISFSLIVMLSGVSFLSSEDYSSAEKCDAAAAAIEATMKEGAEFDHLCVDTDDLVQFLESLPKGEDA